MRNEDPVVGGDEASRHKSVIDREEGSAEGRHGDERRFRIRGPLPASHPIYSTGYIIGSLANTIKPKPRIKLLSSDLENEDLSDRRT
jgi:hypothetical protein